MRQLVDNLRDDPLSIPVHHCRNGLRGLRCAHRAGVAGYVGGMPWLLWPVATAGVFGLAARC